MFLKWMDMQVKPYTDLQLKSGLSWTYATVVLKHELSEILQKEILSVLEFVILSSRVV